MPKVIDHGQRRDDIALAACRAVGRWGFDRLTVARIAAEAGYTTGMIAHYFDSKQDIVLAALRLIARRMEDRLSRRLAEGGADLLDILAQALPVDDQRMLETSVWIGFWGEVRSDERVRAINLIVHGEWTALIRRCVTEAWPEVAELPEPRRRRVCGSIQLFLNGLSASAVTSPQDWPARDQIAYLAEHLERLRAGL